MEHIYDEICDIATIFGIVKIGADVVSDLEANLFRVHEALKDIDVARI